jgi:predicted nucleic acid-binding protein
VIVVDSSVWVDFFNGTSTPEVERLDASLGVMPVNADKAAENSRTLRRQGITVRKTIDGIIATACIETACIEMACIETACIEADRPLLFSDRDCLSFVRHPDLKAA